MATSRRSAQEISKELKRLADRGDDRDRLSLLHEVHVYQEELTVQNEELIRAQSALEETRDRFVELYDFAPNGYLTLDAQAVILQVNLTAAALFGKARHTIEGMPLLAFVAEASRPEFLDYMRRCRAFKGGPAVTADLTIRAPDGLREIQILCRPRRMTASRKREYFAAIIDVTESRQIETERADAAREHAALASRLISIQDDERQRIARDLHDNIGQQVTSLRLKLEAISMAAVDETVRKRIAEAQQTVQQLDKELDFIAAELRPAALDLGFVTAIEHFVREWSSTFAIAADFHSSHAEQRRLTPEVETHLYRFTQEALNNVYKHASASHVSVILERRDRGLVLIVEDDGQGFEVETRGSSQRRGLGLVGMRERAQIIGGTVEIESAPGQGTTVFLRVPDAAADRKRSG